MAFIHSLRYGAIAASVASSEWMPSRNSSGLPVSASTRTPFAPFL